MLLTPGSKRVNDNMNHISGGEPGSPGLSLLLKTDGRIINLGGKASVKMKPGVSNKSRCISRYHRPGRSYTVFCFFVFLFLFLFFFSRLAPVMLFFLGGGVGRVQIPSFGFGYIIFSP